jgi:IS5 family transposase
MNPEKINNSQFNLFRNNLKNQLNPDHELYVLSNLIPWQNLETEFADMHVDSELGGRPPKPVRLMVGILLLQYMHNISDDTVVRTWVENPYWQFFCGYDLLQWDFPINSSSLTRWRKRLGPDRMKKILGLTVEVAVSSGTVSAKDLGKIIVDTTVMPKNIIFPTDSKLQNKSRERLVKLAKENGLDLRQNYNQESKKVIFQIGRYLHAKQMKRAKKAQKRMKTILGRVVRDSERKIKNNEALQVIFAKELEVAKHFLNRKKSDKNKIYSLHEQGVVCISKGKANKKYEFGSKVSLSITHKKGIGIITGCESLLGNPFDGHTLKSSIKLSEEITKIKVTDSFVDKGYKGNEVKNSNVYMSGQKRGITAKIKKEIKRRQAIEPHIGHMKQEVKLGLCRLKGIVGDQTHALLAASAYNMRQIIRHLRIIFAQILFVILSYNNKLQKNT